MRPASVSESLRVVRCRSRIPSSFSSAATLRLTEDFRTPSDWAAAVKLPASITRAKTAIRLRSIVAPIASIRSMPQI